MRMPPDNTRLIWIDLLKFIAIFFVCMGHCIQHFQPGIPSENVLFRFIYSFHMPLFMAITGFFVYKPGNQPLLLPALKKKFRQLILPGISFATVMFLLFSKHRFDPVYWLICLKDSFWFLQSAFICCLLYFVAISFKSDKNKRKGIVITLLLSLIIIYDNVFRMYPAFITGVLAHKYFSIIKHYSKSLSVILVISYTVMFIFLSADFYGPQSFSSITALLTTGFHLVYRIIIGSVATLALICLTYCYRENISNNRILSLMAQGGKYTLGIYILQCYILEGYLRTTLDLSNISLSLFYLVVAPLVSLSVIIVSIMIIRVIEKSRIASYFFLGKPTLKQSSVVSDK